MPGLIVIQGFPLQQSEPASLDEVCPDFLRVFLDLLVIGILGHPTAYAGVPNGHKLMRGSSVSSHQSSDQVALFFAHPGSLPEESLFVTAVQPRLSLFEDRHLLSNSLRRFKTLRQIALFHPNGTAQRSDCLLLQASKHPRKLVRYRQIALNTLNVIQLIGSKL